MRFCPACGPTLGENGRSPPIAELAFLESATSCREAVLPGGFGLPVKFEDDDAAVFDFVNTLITLLVTTEVTFGRSPGRRRSGR